MERPGHAEARHFQQRLPIVIGPAFQQMPPGSLMSAPEKNTANH